MSWNKRTQSYLAIVLSVVYQCFCETKIIDLSHPLSETTLYWPGLPGFNRSLIQKGTNSDGVWIEVGEFSSGEHGGTHLDAPRHFYSGAIDLADIPLSNTVVPGVNIDAVEEAKADSLYAVTVEKLQNWEKEHGRIPNGAGVLIKFGWSSRWPNAEEVYNSDDPTNATTFNFPYVTGDAAEWLMNERNMKLLGLDVPSPDNPAISNLTVHQILLGNNRLILENVLIPDELPASGFQLHAAPLKVANATGAPTRVYAIVTSEGNGSPPEGAHTHQHIVLFIIVSVFILLC